jgi:hypothetical protein
VFNEPHCGHFTNFLLPRSASLSADSDNGEAIPYFSKANLPFGVIQSVVQAGERINSTFAS